MTATTKQAKPQRCPQSGTRAAPYEVTGEYERCPWCLGRVRIRQDRTYGTHYVPRDQETAA